MSVCACVRVMSVCVCMCACDKCVCTCDKCVYMWQVCVHVTSVCVCMCIRRDTKTVHCTCMSCKVNHYTTQTHSTSTVSEPTRWTYTVNVHIVDYEGAGEDKLTPNRVTHSLYNKSKKKIWFTSACNVLPWGGTAWCIPKGIPGGGWCPYIALGCIWGGPTHTVGNTTQNWKNLVIMRFVAILQIETTSKRQPPSNTRKLQILSGHMLAMQIPQPALPHMLQSSESFAQKQNNMG